MQAFDRRHWMKLGGLGLGVATLAPVSALAEGVSSAQAAAPRRFRAALSLSAIGVSANQWEAIEYAARFGFEAVEPHPDFLGQLSDADLAALKQKMAEHNLTWSAAGLPVDFRGSIDQFTSTLRRLPRYAETLQRAGIGRVGTWLAPSHRELTYLQNFRLHAKRLRAVANILGCYGLRLGLEYVGPKTSWSAQRFPFIHTMREMKELIAEIDHPAVGLTLDSWHWYTAGESREDILSLRGDQVIVVHLNDAPAGIPVDQQVDSVRDLPTATGVIDLKGFLSALVEIGFDGPAYIEPFKRELRQMPPQQAVEMTAQAMHKALALLEE